MRRRFLLCTGLLTMLAVTACSDGAPTNSSLMPYNRARANVALADYIQEQIFVLLPKGFEDAVDARWATVRQKKAAGDLAGAKKHLATLAAWIDKKTLEIILPPGATETKAEAAARLVSNMTQWLYGDENAPPVEDLGGEDVALEVVPAGQPSGDISPPSDHAGVSFGPQTEDRIVIISEEEYPGHCNGPLPTTRCQYPLFYKIEIFPNTRIIGRGKFAVCIRTDGERRPIEYPHDEPTAEDPHHEGPIHQRLRLAHNANPLGTSEGGRIEGEIEILEKVAPSDQSGLANCDEPDQIGWSAPKKAMYAMSRFIGRIISPQSAHAIDQGPEHWADFASYFNAIDPSGQPDVSASIVSAPSEAWGGDAITVNITVANASRRGGGHATAASPATMARIDLVDGEGNLVANLAPSFPIAAMQPDDPAQSFTRNLLLPTFSDDRNLTLVLSVDGTGAFGEVSLENNSASQALLVKEKKADLTFDGGFTLSASEVVAGNSVSASPWTVKNTGNKSADFVAQFSLVSASGASTPLGGPITISGLAPGASAAQVAALLSIAATQPAGNYNVVLKLDPANLVEEFDDANNDASQPLVVKDPVPVGLMTGFEDGEALWSNSGLWRRSGLDGFVTCNRTGCLPNPFAGAWSKWYGNPSSGNYNIGANSGTSTSEVFSIPNVSGQVVLEFDTWWEIESVDAPFFDLMQVQLLTPTGVVVLRQLNPTVDANGSSAQAYTSGGFNVAPVWVHHIIDVSAHKGKTVQLRFQFGSQDGLYNDFRGWIVDQVKVRAVGASLMANVTGEPTTPITPIDQLPPPVRPEQ